ncbi:MAG: hypothetical protein H6Q59_1738 [Firmicutes bacterium]|nr:hypothetical protein [Bacillota bacterium]
MRYKLLRIMAYFVMPFLYMLLGYTLIYIAVLPAITSISSVMKVLTTADEPEIRQNIKTIYSPGEKETVSLQKSNPQEEVIEPRIITPEKQEKTPEQVSIAELQFPDLGMQYAVLSCDQIQLEVPVYWGDSKEILEVGVGQYVGSFLPGFKRSILISGHNNSYFNPLQFIETGDILVCDTNYGQYEYAVTTVTVMKAKDAAASLDGMLSIKKEKLILYTCYPFDTLPVNKENRLFVFADKISGPEVQ